MNTSAAESTTQARFVDNGDGTVTDITTNLMWSKETLSKECVTHESAQKTCADLALAAHVDWRLPTLSELFAVADHTRYEPAIDTDAFPDTHSDWYWTSTEYKPDPVCTWVVSFGLGGVDADRRGYGSGYVRAVRSACARQ